MHAMLITFTSAVDVDDLQQPFHDYAEGLRSVDGLISKTWLHDGRTLGGFHLFTSRAAAEQYLDSAMVAGLTGTPAFSEFEIRHWEVLGDLSAMTGTPQLSAA
ncbi:MAG TPA: YdhR family protein [Candidatus Deferrimicrobiaceae bacterium]|nr:YdhR family protein [Candidatus Deferrimicrobiaceae bacterium]